MASGEDHHFCRWMLPAGHSPEAARTRAFPGRSPAEAATALDTMTPRELREVFSGIYGQPTTSNNIGWIRNKLKSALGVGGKKQRAASSRKRWSPVAAPAPAPEQEEAAPKKHRHASPAPPPPSALPVPGARHPARSPSTGSEWDSSTGFVPLGPAADGAAALLAAAAEVEVHGGAAAGLYRSGSGSSGSSPSPAAPSAVPLEALLGGAPLHAALQGHAAPACSAGTSVFGHSVGAGTLPPAPPAGVAGPAQPLPDLRSQVALLRLLAALAAGTSAQAR